MRRDMEVKRLQCEVVLPAEAQRKAVELLSQGTAAQQREQGAAAAEVMRAMADALGTAGPQAREMFVLSQLDTLVAQVASKVKNVTVGEVHVVDGGDGRALPALAASYPADRHVGLRDLERPHRRRSPEDARRRVRTLARDRPDHRGGSR